LRWRDYLGLSVSNLITGVFTSRRGRLKRETREMQAREILKKWWLALKMEKRALESRNLGASRSLKQQGNGFTMKPTPDFSLVTPMSDLDLQNRKIINLCLSNEVCGNLL
jgi:hypothetical protein